MNRNTQQLADASLSAEEITEEADYVNTAVDYVEEKETIADHKCSSFIRPFAPLAVCWLILLVIISLHIYFTAVISENNARLKMMVKNLTAANENLTMKNKELNIQIQELEPAKKNLTEQIQNMEANWNKLNTSRAQWSIDAYCPIKMKKNEKRQCEPCLNGWIMFESNCYAVINPGIYEYLRTWEEAQEDCRGKNSDLVVVVTEAEKNFVNDKSWPGRYNQYWIGLRTENGKWKWVDGTDLTNNSWIQQSAPDGFCAVSVINKGWKAVSCDQKNQWICKKKALSV